MRNFKFERLEIKLLFDSKTPQREVKWRFSNATVEFIVGKELYLNKSPATRIWKEI